MNSETHALLPLGSWAQADGFVGLVAHGDEHNVTLFDPGGRQRRQVARDRVEPVPAAAVRISMTVDLPLPHGLDEESLRRWVALLVDPVLRERAAEAMAEVGLDSGAVRPQITFDAAALTDGLARCLCGATTPAEPGVAVTCGVCGRQAGPPIAPPT